jgi:hypothetical protein
MMGGDDGVEVGGDIEAFFGSLERGQQAEYYESLIAQNRETLLRYGKVARPLDASEA